MRHISRRIFALAAAVSITLVGCSANSETKPDAGSSKPSQSPTASTAQTRTVTDSNGDKIEVPAQPQRVITTHYAGTQAAMNLGLPPVGQADFPESAAPEEMLDQLKQIEVIGRGNELNVEKIAGLKPDLILAANITPEPVLKQLRDIAPVYVWALRGGERAKWDHRVEQIADALNRTDKFRELHDQLDQRIKSMADEYKSVIAGKRVAVVNAFEENNLYVWGSKNMQGTLLLPLGFTWSENADKTVAASGAKEPETNVSSEKVSAAISDADIIFYGTDMRKQPDAKLKAIMDTPLFKELPAVKAGHLYPWGKGTIAGFSDANYSLDRVEEALKSIK